MLVLFDVDGTLLDSQGLGRRCMELAFGEVCRVASAGGNVAFAGRLDNVIWRELCAAHGLHAAEPLHARFRARYAEILREHLGAGSDLAGAAPRPVALPGVAALLDALAGRPRVACGLLTGNYAETARLKIEAAGLDSSRFTVGAWGGDAEQRADLVPIALERLRVARGRTVAPRDVVVVGDTPHDVACARAHGCRALAVATGASSRDELAACAPDLLVPDLTGTDELLDWIGR